MGKLWERLFLAERPSIGMAFFRIAVAVSTGTYLIPTFFSLDRTYLSTAFKTYNPSFFTTDALALVQKSPDGLVVFAVWLFCLAWFCFLIGLFSQLSCILMTFCCYYFYALNNFAMGTLTWDILMVTLVLMCVTPYHGDYFSVDCLRRGDREAYRRARPFFQQRLFQLQIAFIYFYTGLYKITAEGNWLTDKPLYYLMNYPVQGVTKNFLLKDFLAGQPQLCYWIGVLIVAVELAMPFLLFNPRTRRSGIYLGFLFHILLILTLDVPAIFFFLFPAQLLLFIDPEDVIRWVADKRDNNRRSRRMKIIYDGHCRFCQASVKQLEIMDLFGALEMVDFHSADDLKQLHPQLTKELAHSQLHAIDWDGELTGGFFAFRRCCLLLPMLYLLLPIVYFPGAALLGPVIYKAIAKNRYLFHGNRACKDNVCYR